MSGFTFLVRLIGRGISKTDKGGSPMNSLKNKSLFVLMLSTFALSGCQGTLPIFGAQGSNGAQPSSGTLTSNTPGTHGGDVSSDETRPVPHLRDMDNGVIVVMERNEWAGLFLTEGYSFRIDNLNEEFTLELDELLIKETNTTVLRDIDTLYFVYAKALLSRIF